MLNFAVEPVCHQFVFVLVANWLCGYGGYKVVPLWVRYAVALD